MRVTLYQSISVNGMIARADGRGDFFTTTNWTAFVDLAKRDGAMLWGRATHDQVRAWGDTSLAQLAGVQTLVLTRDTQYAAGERWESVGSPKEAIERVASRGGRALLVAGGQAVSTAFAHAGLIDELIVDIAPVVVAHGMPMLEPRALDMKLAQEDVERLAEGVVRLRYRVEKPF